MKDSPYTCIQLIYAALHILLQPIYGFHAWTNVGEERMMSRRMVRKRGWTWSESIVEREDMLTEM